MLKVRVKKLLILAILAFNSMHALEDYADLAELSMTIHSLTNRANELGLLVPATPYSINPVLSDDLNRILGSLETRKISTAQQGQSKVSQTIDSLLNLFMNGTYVIEDGIISFNYLGFPFRSNQAQFANELLLIANLADYISNNYAPNSTVKILSNVFKSPVLYLFLIDIFAQENIKLDLKIIGGISERDFKNLEKPKIKNRIERVSRITDQKILDIHNSSLKKLGIDVYLLSPSTEITKIDNQIICDKIIDDEPSNIKIFPQKLDNSFLTGVFLGVDQGIQSAEMQSFFKALIENTRKGPAALKSLPISGFSCTRKIFEPKIIADLIYNTTKGKSKLQLFLFIDNKVIKLNIAKNAINIINLFGAIDKVILNLKNKTPEEINSPLQNNIKFYKYDKTHKKFVKSKNINDIVTDAINLSDKA